MSKLQTLQEVVVQSHEPHTLGDGASDSELQSN